MTWHKGTSKGRENVSNLCEIVRVFRRVNTVSCAYLKNAANCPTDKIK